jgi:hypothetical protein
MKTNQPNQARAVVFLQTVSVALAQLKQRLQQDYEQAYPDLARVFASSLMQRSQSLGTNIVSALLLPDMVEAHLASLNLRPDRTRHHACERHEFRTHQPAFATYP